MDQIVFLFIILGITTASTNVIPSTQAIPSEVIDPPATDKTIFVDADNGNDDNDGLSEAAAVKTLKNAGNIASSKTKILIRNGVYKNNNYGAGVNNGAAMAIKDKTDILVTAYPGESPVVQFDGAAGITMNNVSRVEISGLEVIGPNSEISLQEAQADRLIKSKKFLGRGIVAWSGNHINIHDNKVHHCPHSGIRVDKGDYIAITDNEVHSNTWYGSSAESAIVIAEATNIDDNDGAKIFLLRNIVYDNQNFIPFYNANGEESEGHGRPDYGTAAQTYIIDGSGVYVTRNKDTYHHGRMLLNHNKAFRNGINGLVVHKTDRAQVVGNVIWDNGKVPKTKPESRQPYAGLTLNHAVGVAVRENFVKTELKEDYAYVAVSGSSIVGDNSGDNWNCKVSAQAGTGYGKIKEPFQAFVSTATWTQCLEAQTI